MTTARLEVRVKSLEETQRSLRELPGRIGDLEHRSIDVVGRHRRASSRRRASPRRVELQIVQLRAEMRSEFSAFHEALVETNRHMRVLHEEVIARIGHRQRLARGRG